MIVRRDLFEVRGYLWEGRFKSCPLSENHLYAAVRYVERNPVRAKIVKNALDYPWSSARAHAGKSEDALLAHNFLVDEIKDWQAYLQGNDKPDDLKRLRGHTNTGRPIGDGKFINLLESATGRVLTKQKPGPKKKGKEKN